MCAHVVVEYEDQVSSIELQDATEASWQHLCLKVEAMSGLQHYAIRYEDESGYLCRLCRDSLEDLIWIAQGAQDKVKLFVRLDEEIPSPSELASLLRISSVGQCSSLSPENLAAEAVDAAAPSHAGTKSVAERSPWACIGSFSGVVWLVMQSSCSLTLRRRLLTVISSVFFMIVAFFCGMPEVGFALSSATTYFMLYASGKCMEKKQNVKQIKSKANSKSIA